MISTLFALALAAQAAPAIPESLRNVAWENLGEDGGVQVYLDPASLERSGTSVRFRVRAVGEPQEDGMRSMLMDLSYDCVARTVTLNGTRRFDMAGGSLGGSDVPEAQRRPSPLNLEVPVERATYERLCGVSNQ